MRQPRRRRVALERAHAVGVAALEAVERARQAAAQRAGLRAVHEHEAVQLELQLDAVQVRHRHCLVGIEQALELRQRAIGGEGEAPIVERPQRRRQHRAVAGGEVDRRAALAQVTQQRAPLLRVLDAKRRPGIPGCAGVESGGPGGREHRSPP
jgi:hypothetical protein